MAFEEKIKLVAFTNDDLEILSYLCQDSIVSKEEMFFDYKKKLFIATLSRYCWENVKAYSKKNNNVNFRVISGLQIKNVKAVKYKNFNFSMPFLNLLAIIQKKNKIILKFSESIELILSCNKINVLLEDIDIPWPTKLKPKHDEK